MLDRARSHDPKNPSIFRAVANFYREQHDYKAAISALKSAPGPNPEVLADLGYSYELDGNRQQAAETYSKAANLAPRQIGLQLSAAQAELHVAEIDRRANVSCPRRADRSESLSAARAEGAACPDRKS